MKKIILSTILYLSFFVVVCSVESKAQSVSSDDIKAQLVKDWERAKAYTVEYLNALPADKYSFKAHDSIRSFAQQMLHLAAANYFLLSNVSGEMPPSWVSFGLERRATAQTRDSVMFCVTASYDYAINAVKTSDMAKWGEKKKLFGRFEETKFAIINKAFEHQGHHRGQTTIYIRLQGIKPPEEKLF